jgi:hypothetical protein
MAIASSSTGLVDRMIRAAKLSVPLYEEVEADTTATNQALTVVVIVSVLSGIGAGLAVGGSAGNVVGAALFAVINALIGWAVWSYVIYFVGTRMFGGTATYGELLRTLGFASVPRALGLFAFLGVLGTAISTIGALWFLVAGFIATRQALDISNGKTVGTILIAFIAIVCVIVLLGLILAAIGLGALAGAGMLSRP